MSKKNKKKWGPSQPAPPIQPAPPQVGGGPIWPGVHPMHWETVIVEEGPVYTQRARVPGHDGYLWRCIGIWLQAHGGNMVAMAYVPPYGEPPDWGMGSR